MPHRRTVKKGSFSSHFDDLLKHFAHNKVETSALPRAAQKSPIRPKRKSKISVHQALFERSQH
jgi:hypothetical protein